MNGILNDALLALALLASEESSAPEEVARELGGVGRRTVNDTFGGAAVDIAGLDQKCRDSETVCRNG
jgi:hypothetical protein